MQTVVPAEPARPPMVGIASDALVPALARDHAAPEPTLALAKAESMKRSRQQSCRDLLEASQAMPSADECGLWMKPAARAKPARPHLVGAAEAAPWLATQKR